MAVLGLSSCDSNKSTVEDLTNQFIAAVKDGDKATAYDIYPAAKLYGDLSLPESIEKGNLDIQKNEKDSSYIVSIKNTRMSKIIFKPTDNKTFKIINTFSVLKLDSVSNELALKTGVPIKKMPDLELGKLMLESSDFISYLINKYSNNMSLSLIKEPCQAESEDGHLQEGRLSIAHQWKDRQQEHGEDNSVCCGDS